MLARLARTAGVARLVAVGFEGETDPALGRLVDDLAWVRVGQLGKLIKAFRARGVKRCVMAGQVNPKNLFDLRPDLRAVSLLIRLKERNAQTIFTAIANELRKDGIELVDARPWLAPVMPAVGYRTGPKPSADQIEDVAFGFRMAKEVSRLDIGQTVVVKNGTVLAAEGFEGTDACLRRGGELAGNSGGAVGVKVASAKHDFRFDIPCLGPQTIRTCGEAQVAVMAFEAGNTLLLDREEVEEQATVQGVTLMAVSEVSQPLSHA
jgi:DUF1009 family protein